MVSVTQATEPLKHNWTEVLKVQKFRDLCQSTEVLPEFYQNYTFSEDCLFVNIYVPGENELRHVNIGLAKPEASKGDQFHENKSHFKFNRFKPTEARPRLTEI